MVWPDCIPWVLVTLLIISGLSYGSESTEKSRHKRTLYQEQPRMSSESGNLIFHTGPAKNIEFRTGSQGRIRINEEDLAETFSQIKKNKDEILELKRVTNIPQNVSNQITYLHSKIMNIEGRLQNLEQSFLRKACSSNPCQNSGTCINLLDAFFCLCPNNWQGPFCSVDVNECQIYSGTPLGCQNGATCVNTPGSYSCTCTPETYGFQCTSKFDDCQQGSTALCEHGRCIDEIREQHNQPKYSCSCDSGWKSAPENPSCSVDVDECSLPQPPCSLNPPVQCHNTLGSYLCGLCPAGWQGNGYSCQDINECLTDNGGCSTTPLVQCINTMGSSYCSHCPPGYHGDGKVCTQVDICSVNNGGCHPLATCTSRSGPVPNCVCPAGYTGNGYGSSGCVALSHICQNQNPCLNGQCLDTFSGYHCLCDPGWNGVNCTENIDECSSNPCQHGGSCTDRVNGYSCECTNTWAGPECQRPQQVCGGFLSNPSGSFSYPNNPGTERYDHQVSCAWVIRTTHDKILRITFPFFQLEQSSNCRSDYLQIHDGESSSAQMLGKYCGSTHPDELFSSHNSLYIWFRSDRTVNSGGFTVHWESRQPECGGELSNTYGSINSPGYPGNYPLNRDCYWIISTNPGLLITFAFGTLRLEHHDNCSQDYLEIRDGLLLQDPLLGKYCSTWSPPPLQTTGPYAWVHFHSNAANNDRGFHVTYTTSPADPNCGGNFTDSMGVIVSPYWPNSYLSNRQCIYIIRQPAHEKISLNFTHLELESHPDCSWNFVEIRDGDTETSPLINKLCRNVLPSTITSNSNNLWIKFKSDTSVQRSSFRALYEVACGGALSGEGVLRSPYYSRAISHGKICEWVISQPEGNVILLNFTDFQIYNITTCDSDYVLIRDGSNANSPSLGKYCGVTAPSIIQSSQNYLYVKFRASSVTNLGFMAEYKPLDAVCGGTFTEPDGTISSPGYPITYPHGVKCRWTISVQPGYLIRLTIVSFYLEFDYNCNRDYLEIYDNSTMTKLGRYCGSSIPPSVTSSGNTLMLYFVTNRNTASEGFSASYASLNASGVCSHDYTEATGVLSSPNYPNHYPARMMCIYRITVGNNKQIALHFTNFSLESAGCKRDYVEIRDGGYETSPLRGKYCGNTLPPLTISHSNKLWIKFVSDVYVTYTGFSAYWDGTSTGCGGTLTTSSGLFMSPNYPMPYHHNAECYWLLQSSHGSPFEIQFEQFHLEYHERCRYDYLAVYDGNSTSAKMLGKFCGNQIPPTIRSSGDRLYVKLRTDVSLGGGGFLAHYKQICQGVVTANHSWGILESLNYPSNYPANAYCNWTIQGTSGNTLNYSFTALSVTGGTNCERDNIKLYDGPNAQSRLIGTFCGDTDLPSGGTLSSSLHVVFLSDNVVESSGFQMLWQVNGCGGELSGTSGSFHSPGYPNKYPHNRECHWFIHTAPGSSIQLTIVEFDIEYHSSCNYDVLEVYGGPDFSSPRLAQLCVPRSPSNPLHVSSTGNTMAVRFKTDRSVNKKGFNATWQERAGGCGGIFQLPNGEIHSPNYPQSYSNNTDCSWLIQVESGHHVLLNFTDFELETHRTCNYDYVAVFDGPSSDAPLLRKVCGGQRPSPITSTLNAMFVRFRSDSSVHHRGFRAHFAEACGSVLEADSVGAAISSPQYPAHYPNNQNCSWILQAQEPFNHITLSFTDFATEDFRHNCTTDYVEIREGDNYDAPLQGRYCGTTMPHPLTSFGRTLSISFISNNVATAKGFHAIFAASTSACGGIFHMERGAFNSPNFPEPYPPNIECVWNIPTSPGNRLQLSFTEFELEESANCAKDYLEIREGALESQLMGRYCGSSLVLNHTSIITSQFLWVKFVSDSSGSGLGFMATFSHLFGNNIVGSSGQIASPLWPRNYPHNSNYQWTITVNATQLIHGQLQQMSIEESSSCRYDKLKVYDGPNIHSHLIDVYCGVTLSSFTSSGNSVTLQFISDISVSGKGFLLDWYAVEAPTDIGQTVPTGACGGVATASNAPLFLFSPGWPSDYSNMANCIWVIRSRSSTVEFNILALDIETHGSCNYDKLVFRDGDNSLAPVLSTVCGREIPGPIRSTGDSMFIQFTSDGSVTGAGFNASFHKSCGGYLHANRGVITSPNYGQTYPANLNCSWHVLVTSGFIIDVHFEQPFEVLNEDASCSHGDYVELRNGPDLFAPPLGLNGGNGRFCGSSPFSTMHTSDNQLFVLFTSDSHNGGKGFQLKYEAKSLACGGNFYISHSSSSGYVHSPNYPGNYPPHADCVWTVTVLYGEAVELQFEDQFDIEPSPNCTSSYLELRDGADSSSPLIAQLCGNSLPPIQRSSGPTLYMRFRSDSTDARAGFNAKYSRAPCGGTLTGQNGFIKSLGFPDLHYQDNLQCEWFLHGPMGHYLSISFEALDIQNSTECANDYLEIREHDASGDLLGKYCGATIPGALDTPDNLAYIKFVADDSINAPGFMLRFAASFQACGGELRGTTGIFTSPNNLNPSLHKLKCEWRIVVPLGRRVTLTFSDMNFGFSQNCSSDYVAVHNGVGENTPMLSKLCGVVNPGTQVKSSGNKITVIMVKSHNEAEESFRIIYSSEEDAVCGGLLLSSKGGNLTSPGYDGTSNYLNNLNCEWVIQNSHPSATTVYLSFGDFKLEEHINCQNDYLEIRLGDADGELLYRLCGSRVRLEPLLIAAPQIWMQFLSNAENTNRGFFIRYTSSACGGIQEAESGIISSPNYPQPYNSSSHCSWLLVAPEGHTINLTFVTFAVERHSSCPWDSVTILNGGSLSSPIIGRYCGNTSPGTIQSGSNKLLINFNSDHSVQGDGFYATWTADSLGCGGILHSENGTIRSPYWPHNFPSNIRCAWTIIAHESKHLEITFDENFQIPDTNGQCQSSYVKVLSGSSEEQEDAVLAVGCGNSAPVSVVAPRNVITVLFQSQDDPGQGFSASYISRCGANFTAQSGQIVSPNFPSQYDNNLNCNYTIDVEPQSVVILHFESFDLQSPGILEICSYDGVKIFKKNSANLSHMETICGNEVPAPVSIFGSTLLNFYTDSHTVGMGFLVTYRIIACGGVFNSSVGTISSPTHSFSDYHHNMNCSYNITVRRNKIVQLKFNSFQLEASSSCYKDYVAVYDGPNTLAPLLGKFCGTALPPTIRTSTNNLFLVFTTDFLEAAGGWKASYTETIGPQQGCGGYLTNSSFTFGSPDSNMDGKYDKDLECVWTIVTSVNRLINLTFNTFQLEAASGFQNCRYDYVKLYDGSNDNATLAGTFCGSNIPAPFLSTDNFLTIKFVTDRSVERAGFTATYTTMDRLCGGTYNATSVSQTMTSPYFPQAYPPFTVCRWVIDAPPEQQVQLVVQMFHLHSSQDCSQNYLEFQDFPLSNQEHADRVHRFCGDENVTVPVFYSYRRTAIIIFRSEAYMTNNGLNFSYKASGCSREYNQSFGYLKSPGWPDSYPRNLNCVIILRAPQNHTLSLFFTSFNLEGFGCQNDFLEVRNGSDASSPLLGKYCGSALPEPIFPRNHVVYLHFKSDALLSRRGYEITWTSSPSGCGGTLYGEAGSLTSPEYPASYPNQTDCEWIIKAPKGRTVTINFVFISIEDPGDCTRNYLILYNGPDHRHPQIGPYCGMDTNIDSFSAASHQVFIKFHSEYVTLLSGFRLTWNS